MQQTYRLGVVKDDRKILKSILKGNWKFGLHPIISSGEPVTCCKGESALVLQAPEVFTTERLVLRRPRLSDAEAIFEYASDPTVIHYMDYCPRTDVNEVVKFLEGQSERWKSGCNAPQESDKELRVVSLS